MWISKKRWEKMQTEVNRTQNHLGRVQAQVIALQRELADELSSLANNGVATAINKLNQEVFKDKKDDTLSGGTLTATLLSMYTGDKYELPQSPTLAGKVDAIIKHLGIKVDVAPRKDAEVVVKKPVPKASKK